MTHVDLCVIGSGSGNSIIDEQFDGWSVALVDDAPWFGGTCLNVGCIPTKMYVFPADLAAEAAQSGRLGIDLRVGPADWPAIRDRIFGRIDEIAASGEKYRAGADNVTLIRETVRFTGPNTLITDSGQVLTADRIVLAAGSRPRIPPIPGLEEAGYTTSDTVMRLEQLPERLVILGGGFIAAEFAHVFASLGSKVSIVNKSASLLMAEDESITEAYTKAAVERHDVHLSATAKKIETVAGGKRVHVAEADGSTTVLEADEILVAVGRIPNGDRLDLDEAGVVMDDEGFVVVDDQQRTSADCVWALGDVCSPSLLKHVANAEERTVQHNLLHPETPAATNHQHIPHAVFTHPQVGAVGLTEQEARDHGIDVAVVTHPMGDVAYGWAMEDDTGFCKLIADRATGRLVGAHIFGYQASMLVQTVIMAMSAELRVKGLARSQYWIHPALPEVIENALIKLESELG